MKPWKKGRNQKGKSDLLVGCRVEGVRRPWMWLVCCLGDDIRGDDIRRFPLDLDQNLWNLAMTGLGHG
jgi:hypothetical protein